MWITEIVLYIFLFTTSNVFLKLRPQKDPCYDHEAETKDSQTEEEVKKMKQRQTYIKRVIVHPTFHNISYVEAEKLMANMEQGEVVVRPSSKVSML